MSRPRVGVDPRSRGSEPSPPTPAPRTPRDAPGAAPAVTPGCCRPGASAVAGAEPAGAGGRGPGAGGAGGRAARPSRAEGSLSRPPASTARPRGRASPTHDRGQVPTGEPGQLDGDKAAAVAKEDVGTTEEPHRDPQAAEQEVTRASAASGHPHFLSVIN